jgi:hypothetical protein
VSGSSIPNIAVSLLRAVEAGEETIALERELAALDRERLIGALPDDRAKKAFWIDLYNAFVQITLAANSQLFEDKNTFFGAKRLPIAGQYLSLDDIEHGLLRRSQLKRGLGYLPNPLPGGFERTMRVEKRDPRIHFALNCGAASCPPVAAYTPEEIDHQLDLASESYLHGEVKYDASKDLARVPRLCLWFHGDFRGQAGIRSLLRRYDVIPATVTPSIRYQGYDWTLDRGNFEENPSELTDDPS